MEDLNKLFDSTLIDTVQLDNEANARILRELGKEYNHKLRNLLWRKKPGYKLKSLDKNEKETFKTFDNFSLCNRIKFNMQLLFK